MNAAHLLTPLDDLSDEELMELLAGGQSEALVPLHGRYAALVFNIVAHSLDRSAAEEIVQDVFVAVWSKAGTYDPARGLVRPWLLQIAHSRVVNELRRRNRRPQTLPDPDGFRLASVRDEGPSPEEAAWQEFRQKAVREAVSALPPAQRQALSLAFFEDLSHPQIAAFLGLPLGTAKTRVRDGVKKLRHSLAAVVAIALALIVGLGLLVNQYRKQQAELHRQNDALGMVTTSDMQELHLSPAPGLPADAHGGYRVRAGGGLAILTVSHLPAAPAGSVYRGWVHDVDGWKSLGVIHLDSAGHALVIVDIKGLGMPDQIEVTLETSESGSSPGGSVKVSWTQS